MDYSRQWAVRCVHEAQLWPNNSFITLTYSPEHVPADGSLVRSHYQNFMKRLRKYFEPLTIRFYQCGEYGEKLGRPHYHALLFNLEFPDKELWKMEHDTPLYQSPTLTKLWGKGHCSIGEVNIKTAAYVSRYIMKKITGELSFDHYERIDQVTGEIYNLEPEYTTMSLKPGIGKRWYDKYKSDVFPDDFVVMNGKKYKTPRYYTEILRATDPEMYEKIIQKRTASLEKHQQDNTPERLSARHECARAKLKQMIRPLV